MSLTGCNSEVFARFWLCILVIFILPSMVDTEWSLEVTLITVITFLFKIGNPKLFRRDSEENVSIRRGFVSVFWW